MYKANLWIISGAAMHGGVLQHTRFVSLIRENDPVRV